MAQAIKGVEQDAPNHRKAFPGSEGFGSESAGWCSRTCGPSQADPTGDREQHDFRSFHEIPSQTPTTSQRFERMIVESSRTQQRPADVLDVEAVRKLPRALKRKSRLHCCEGVFMSDIAFNPGVGSGYSGSIDRTDKLQRPQSKQHFSVREPKYQTRRPH